MSMDYAKLRLVPVLTVLLVTGFLITSLTSFFVSRESLRSEIALNELPLTSDNIYSEIQRDLLRPVFISSVMATDTFLRDWVLGGEQGPEKITRYLLEIKTKYNTFTSFFVSEASKTYYHSAGILKQVSTTDPRDNWYFRVKGLEEHYEINVDPDKANKDAMTIFVNYRVYDYDQNYIGVTGVGLTVNAVKTLIELYQKKYSRTIYFIDDDGTITLTGSDFKETKDSLKSKDYFPLFTRNMGALEGNSFSYERDGQVVHTNIRYIDEFKWHLVVEQPEQEVVQEIYRTLLINLFLCVVVTAVVLVLVNYSITAYKKRIETLRGIVPICSFCKQIRDDKGYWNRVDAYIAKHTEAQFSHSICPDCVREHYPEAGKILDENVKEE
ncbi:cache domain-containing protein [Desulforhopalus sp. 52FAK]